MNIWLKEEHISKYGRLVSSLLARSEVIPLFLAIYPALTLAANNAREIALANALRPMVLSLLGAASIYLFFRILRQDSNRASLITGWLLLLFFSYGHIYTLLKSVQFFGEPIGRHRYLAPILLVLVLLGLWAVFRKAAKIAPILPLLRAFTGLLVLVSLLRLGLYLFEFKRHELSPKEVSKVPQALSIPANGVLPDIYYIILDSYGRSDILGDIYGYHNHDFLQELENLGFYVANESISNYAYTILSLASSLNYTYLTDLGIGQDSERSASDWYALTPLIQNSQIRRDLASLGYAFVAFDSGYRPTSIEDADHYLSRRQGGSWLLAAAGTISPLETMLIETTALKIFLDGGEILSARRSPYDQHRKLILFELEALSKAPGINSPKFVFAHILLPHKPYVFGPINEEQTPSEAFTFASIDLPTDAGSDRERYIDQLVFTNEAIVDVIKKILADSPTPPIIILQGDHGLPINDVSPTGRMAILNAYYLPWPALGLLYPEISPVNSFRVVLNAVFDAGIPLLEDIGFYSRYPDLFMFLHTVTLDESP